MSSRAVRPGRAVGRASRPWLAASAFATVGALATQALIWITYGSSNLRRLAGDDPAQHGDFEIFRSSARALLDGTDLYDTGTSLPNLNPPILSVVLVPFAHLEQIVAFRAWTLLSLVLVLASVVAVAREVALTGTRTAVTLTAILLGAPMLATLGLGQIYALLTALLTGAWLLQRRSRPAGCGALLGLAVAVKPSLAPLLLLGFARSSRPEAVGAWTAAAGATVTAVVVAGPAATARWVEVILDQPLLTYFDNASLPAALVRLTSENEWGEPLIAVPGGFAVGMSVGLLGIVATLVLVRRGTVGADAAVWAVAAAALVASPLTWHTYLLVLAPALPLVLAGSRAAAAPLLALPLIGQEWPAIWYDGTGTASAVPLSLYAAVLVTHLLVIARAPDAVPPPRAGSLPTPHHAGSARRTPSELR